MAKSSNKEQLTPLSLPFSPKALQNERAHHLQAKELAENSAPSSYI
jgi:hypothetical protein